MNASKSVLVMIIILDAVMIGGLGYGINQNENGLCLSVTGQHGYVSLTFETLSALDSKMLFNGTTTSLLIFANESISIKPIGCGLFPSHLTKISLPNPIYLFTEKDTGNATYGYQPFTIDYRAIPWYLCDTGPGMTNPNAPGCDPFVQVYSP